MRLSSHAFNTVVGGMILAPLSVANDPSGASTNPGQATTIRDSMFAWVRCLWD